METVTVLFDSCWFDQVETDTACLVNLYERVLMTSLVMASGWLRWQQPSPHHQTKVPPRGANLRVRFVYAPPGAVIFREAILQPNLRKAAAACEIM
jgi:hypothetical protein